MRVITEEILRLELEREGYPAVYDLPDGAIITPAARSMLADRRIHLKESSAGRNKPPTKPEHKAHLRNGVLVSKTHKQIMFRGKLDSLEGKIILAQVRLLALGHSRLVEDLQELLEAVRNVLRSEVTEEPLQQTMLLGMTDMELRNASHYPGEQLGVSHFIPDYSMGEEMALLNCLRTEARETELAACHAFMTGYESGAVRRPDIIRILNRFSSAFYLMMCRLKSGGFYKGGEEDG